MLRWMMHVNSIERGEKMPTTLAKVKKKRNTNAYEAVTPWIVYTLFNKYAKHKYSKIQ